ncbi:MAG: aminotransferase class III-fold pyridoxal phosphate-dependent enzyme, partial [Flavobacteriales bacterium]|nr:aminotransferase class III-fold pyridoxal phosphate-dependent enzyme [Flavobacteriales bacterium]
RLSRSRKIEQIVLATSVDARNAPLIEHVEKLGYLTVRGSESDVLQRYLDAARLAHADVVVRITGDCPLIDPDLVDQVVESFLATRVDYLSNAAPATFPDGLDTEVFTMDALERAARETQEVFDREHVTPYLRKTGLFRTDSYTNKQDLSGLRWTVDEPEDFTVVSNIFNHFAPEIHFTWQQVLELQKQQPILFAANQQIMRNEGATMGTGQKLYKRAKKVIPGGTMLLSKRPEMFLPEHWPSYFSKAKGCTVWDLDGNQYTDMSIMGIGTNTLGYGHPEVDEAVMQTVTNGNMSTFNCPEEVYLAEKLVELHPWADMVRLARSGGEINSIAVRIARAATGRDKIAICGYHGWHDWYLATNLGNGKNLDGHLLPGLNPAGVPRGLSGTTLPFNYNQSDELEAIIATNPGQIAAIKMEVSRNIGPEDGFLQKVRNIASTNDIVLIFDECTSGFRETYGGLYKKYGVEPDMAIFAKTLGNGYAISACIGRKEVMQAAQQTFISSTFWTERIGPTAALKTLEVMEREKSWEKITHIGNHISNRWQALADSYGLPIQRWGIPALSGFTIVSDNTLAYKTLITQEMLKRGYLAGNSVYACIAHTPEIIDGYFEALEPIFTLIRECEDGRDVNGLLEGPVCHGGFKRLN